MIARLTSILRRIHQFHTPISRLAGWPEERHPTTGILFSAGIHVLVVVLVLISPFINPRGAIILPEVYQVELVNVAEYKAANTPERSKTIKVNKPVKVKIASHAKAPVKTIPSKAVSLNPIRDRLLKEARNLEEADHLQLAARLARIRSEAEAEKMREIARKEAGEAVDALARALGSEQMTEDEKSVEPPPVEEEHEAAQDNGENIVHDSDSRVAGIISAGYLSRLGAIIQRHWVLPDLQKKWPRDMQARIRVRINPEGKIEHITFLKRARDFRFNVQAEKALRRASPFPPPPPEIAAEAGEIVLTFTPEEVK